MKKTKKIFALLLVFVMALAMNVTVFAANGDITITNATVGKDYSAYKLFDATYNATTGTTSYTVKENDSIYNVIKEDPNAPFTIGTRADSNENYTVTQKTGVSNENVITWIEENFDKLALEAEASTAEGGATSETVTFSGLSYGYYYVTSTLGTLVTIDTNTPSVDILDKNQKPGTDFKKEVDGTDKVVQIGTPFTFTETFTATNYDG